MEEHTDNSKNGFSSNIFGPPLWLFLHIISFNYPVNPTKKEKQVYRDFILNLKYILPCRTCRDNLTKNFQELPLTMKDMESRDTFSLYVYNLHNIINKMLNKNVNITYDEVKRQYEQYRAKCEKKNKTIKNKHVGCVVPLNSKHKKKCVIKIVKTRKLQNK
jgi:hypothetical protein